MFEHLEDVVMRNNELLNMMSEPEVANDSARLQRVMREQGDIAQIVEAYEKYKTACVTVDDSLTMLEEESDEEMRQMIKDDLSQARSDKEELEKQIRIILLPTDPNDSKNVIVEIRAGAGGDEAALFASEIYRMYQHYAAERGWVTELLEIEETGIGGMKKVNFMVKGNGAYSVLKYESGVHRVQRVPETESGGRIHTSTCTVAVMPEAEDVDIEVNDKDVRIDVMRASGNGGQCVNTTDSAVRLTHYPTGIVIYSQTEKSQIQNKAKAYALLRTKLYDMELQRREKEASEQRLSQIGTGDRSEKIRTYNFPQGRVTDHRINLTLYKLEKVMNGDLQEILDALMTADQEKKLLKMEAN
jgi:peptide chain release factor 1